ncbi:MAG: hypothetical protein H0Z19_00250 [Archaeoglobus sp.]|uniref:hypothetical protein n=1 Tax=Archaeoglobus sp. TaxID=1872626 RepID=UPI001D7AAB00|nr:hypothetical protein [Archaeoglobus sp.]MBO8178906.1 hypothetical protein [Archaeoglobus sp.]
MLTRVMALGSQFLAEMYPILAPLTVVLATGILFLIMLGLFGNRLSKLDKRQIRRALTVAVISFYFGTILCAVAGIFKPDEEFFKLIDGLNLAFITTVSFYFGSRTVERYIEAKYPESAESRHHKEDEGLQ